MAKYRIVDLDTREDADGSSASGLLSQRWHLQGALPSTRACRPRVLDATRSIGTKARLAFALLIYTGQRRSDIVQLGHQHLVNGELRFTQAKNAGRKPVRMVIPILPALQHVLDHSPCGDPTFLVTEFGKSLTVAGFGNWFRDRCDEAGLKVIAAHGLRKAFQAIGGWKASPTAS